MDTEICNGLSPVLPQWRTPTLLILFALQYERVIMCLTLAYFKSYWQRARLYFGVLLCCPLLCKKVFGPSCSSVWSLWSVWSFFRCLAIYDIQLHQILRDQWRKTDMYADIERIAINRVCLLTSVTCDPNGSYHFHGLLPSVMRNWRISCTVWLFSSVLLFIIVWKAYAWLCNHKCRST